MEESSQLDFAERIRNIESSTKQKARSRCQVSLWEQTSITNKDASVLSALPRRETRGEQIPRELLYDSNMPFPRGAYSMGSRAWTDWKMRKKKCVAVMRQFAPWSLLASRHLISSGRVSWYAKCCPVHNIMYVAIYSMTYCVTHLPVILQGRVLKSKKIFFESFPNFFSLTHRYE